MRGFHPQPRVTFSPPAAGVLSTFPFCGPGRPAPVFLSPCGAAFVGLPGRPRPLSLGPTGQFTLPHPGFCRLRRRGRFQLFSREKSCKSTHKGASPLRNPPIFLMRTQRPSLRLERFIHVLFRAQRQGLVLSPDSASCGAASQKRLPLRRALRAYHSFGLGSRRLIHMKCGAISDLVLLFCRSSSYGKTDGSTPLTGRQPKSVELVL